MPPAFPREEFRSRQDRLRAQLEADDVDACVITAPENICYLTGHATPGYYTYQALVFPQDDEPILVLRESEVINGKDLTYLESYAGYRDGDDPVVATAQAVRAASGTRRIGVEDRSWFLTPAQQRQLLAELDDPATVHIDDLVQRFRLVKSPLEIDAIRRAADIVNVAARASVGAIEPGVRDRDVAATIFDHLVREGSEYLGMEPFVASGPRSGSIHSSWSDRRIDDGDPVLVEFAAAHHRYHAVLMHTVAVGVVPDELRHVEETCRAALRATIAAIQPGNSGEDCHRACVRAIEEAGLLDYYRKRSGYSIGLAFAPDWGEGGLLSLGYGQHQPLEPGMVVHAVPAIRVPRVGGFGFSATVLVTDGGPEVLTSLD